MNVNSSTSAAPSQTADAVPAIMLKKALDIQAQSALALINAIPQPPQQSAANLPPHLGQNVNTTA